ncbi:tetratricopeptide repeat protein [Methylobacterium nigriterrae]|uniref:tetratricopeptide repeat protein n=1 Tax=Methylobacterium nigriterrae TaxID=3127512 RepID=UPI0030133BF9
MSVTGSKNTDDAALSLWALHQRSAADWRALFRQRPGEGLAWIRFAAGHGFRAAQLVLGQMHLDGHGVARDPAQAYRWFSRAAAIGSLEARNMVGRCHELGWGVPIDEAEALRHYRRAAAGGLAWAQYNVGCLLLYGTGVRRDHAQAFASFSRAAAQGHAKAQGLLGRCHEEGWGTAVDREAGVACYTLAADGGDCWAALNLGLLRAEAGRGVEAEALFRRALDTATPNCHRAIAATLTHVTDAGFQAIAAEATARAGTVERCPAPAHATLRPATASSARSLHLDGAILLGFVLGRTHARRRRISRVATGAPRG